MDIVADSLLQADKVAARLAAQRIEKMSAKETVDVASNAFSAEVAASAAKSKMKEFNKPFVKDQSRLPDEAMEVASIEAESRKSATKKAIKGLETVLATKLVESMLPKDQSRIYGEGTAGEVWRGFHVDIMGKAIAAKDLFETQGETDQLAKPVRKANAIVPFAG